MEFHMKYIGGRNMTISGQKPVNLPGSIVISSTELVFFPTLVQLFKYQHIDSLEDSRD